VGLPFAFAGGMTAIALAVGRGAAGGVLVVEIEMGHVLGLAGALVAALTFERGDYPRRAWLLGAACFGLLLVADAGTVPAVAEAVGPRTDLARGLVSMVANVAWVAQMAMLARVWSVAGLDEDATVASRRGWLVGAALAAIAIEGGPFVHDVRALLGGNGHALIAIADELGASVGLALLAPVMRTALTMSGGLLRWPWGLLTASGLGWALLDAVTAGGDAMGAGGVRFHIATEAIRALACGAYCAAGLAHRRAVVAG
jgi:hypothetical protein